MVPYSEKFSCCCNQPCEKSRCRMKGESRRRDWEGVCGGVFLLLLKSHLKYNLTCADLVQSKQANAIADLGQYSDERFERVIVLPWNICFVLLLFFLSWFLPLPQKIPIFSLSKDCSEVMLGVADHILHVREGSFCLYFMTVLGFFFSWTASSC